jgi:hypothetical protein
MCFTEAYRGVMKTNLRLKTVFERAQWKLMGILKYDIKIYVGI